MLNLSVVKLHLLSLIGVAFRVSVQKALMLFPICPHTNLIFPKEKVLQTFQQRHFQLTLSNVVAGPGVVLRYLTVIN